MLRAIVPTDRDVAFANESFLIGVLQAVAGGALVAAIAQFPNLKAIAGLFAVTLFMTLMTIALAAAVVAAFCKHEYKKWDIKALVSLKQGDSVEAKDRSSKSRRHLDSMRGAMLVAVVAVIGGLGVLIAGFWLHAYRLV